MVSCFLATCPQSHRRPRDLVRQNWSHLVSEATPVWAVLVDDRPAIVAPVDDRLVVVCGGPRAVDWTVGFGHVTEVSSARSVVYVVDDDGHCYDFTFLDGEDAVRAVELIDERRAGARGGGPGADGDGDGVGDREAQMAMAAAGRGDGEQVDLGWAARPDGGPGNPMPGIGWLHQPGGDPLPLVSRPTADATEPARVSLEKGPAPSAADDPPTTEDGATGATGATGGGEEQPADDTADPADEPRDVESPTGGFVELPIEREVAMAIARSGGRPIDWWSIPPRGSQPVPPPAAPLPIPAQAAAHASESVLLVTTEAVPGRAVLDVHGDVLAVASWPPSVPAGRSVHELARERLAQAVLRRGGNALVGLRYGATGMIGGDVVAYGTAVTLAPVDVEPAAEADSRARDAVDR